MHAHDYSCHSVMPVMVAVLIVLMLGKSANSSAAQSCKRWSGQVVMLRLHAMCILLAGGCMVTAISCAKLHALVQAVRDDISSLLTPVVYCLKGHCPQNTCTSR